VSAAARTFSCRATRSSAAPTRARTATPPASEAMTGRVAWITIAPVKGLALVRREEVALERAGVVGNRRYYLIDAGGQMTNAKRIGGLMSVVPDVDDVAGTLTLHFPDGAVVTG